MLLETGFDYENGVAVQTRTARQTVEIQDGKIVALRENKLHPDATLPHYDAGGKLMLPTTRDMHIHLDKTFYGGPWRSLNRPAGTTIQDMIKLEQKMLPELQPYTQERAEKLIDLLQSKGTTIARSHCNIEPVSGLKNLQNLQAVLARRQAVRITSADWTRPVSMARWKNPSTPCSRLRWTTTKASIFTCTKPLRQAWQPSIIWLKR